MPLKRPIGGSGDAGAAKAPEHDMEIETEVAVTGCELSLHPDIIDGVELPQPEAEFHTGSDDDSDDEPGDDSDDHSGDDSDDEDNWLVIYTHLCVK